MSHWRIANACNVLVGALVGADQHWESQDVTSGETGVCTIEGCLPSPRFTVCKRVQPFLTWFSAMMACGVHKCCIPCAQVPKFLFNSSSKPGAKSATFFCGDGFTFYDVLRGSRVMCLPDKCCTTCALQSLTVWPRAIVNFFSNLIIRLIPHHAMQLFRVPG